MNGGWSMKLDYYQREAYSTALHKDKVLYPCLGLVGEMGELVARLNEDTIHMDKVFGEIGDVCWYAGALATDLNLKLSEIVGVESFEDIKPLYCTYVEMVIYLGKVCECAKKLIRDKNESKKEGIKHYLRLIILALSSICREHNLNLTMIADSNLVKVLDRKVRGVTHGDGDNR